ncbi:hypothetical protein ACH5RR_006731 [Cinchona calisaya]|uniref:Uncharacterized protein n=1 Tax=Cinchona calisaya TaxID=153742 RepID=A0ABD3APV1_9GENT
MIIHAQTVGTLGLSSTDKEAIPTLLTTAALLDKMENPSPTQTPLKIDVVAVNDQAPIVPSADNGANGLSNEALDFSDIAPPDDSYKTVFQPRTHDVGMKMLETTSLHGKLWLPECVCDNHHIKFRYSRKRKVILSTNIVDSLPDSNSVSQLDMPQEVLSKVLHDFMAQLKSKGIGLDALTFPKWRIKYSKQFIVTRTILTTEATWSNSNFSLDVSQ